METLDPARRAPDERIAFGGNLARLRREAGLTVEALAERIGASAKQVGRLERGENTPRPATVTKLAKALRVKPAKLWEAEALALAVDGLTAASRIEDAVLLERARCANVALDYAVERETPAEGGASEVIRRASVATANEIARRIISEEAPPAETIADVARVAGVAV